MSCLISVHHGYEYRYSPKVQSASAVLAHDLGHMVTFVTNQGQFHGFPHSDIYEVYATHEDMVVAAIKSGVPFKIVR